MQMTTLETVLAGHPFFRGLDSGYTQFIAGCGANVHFNPGEVIFRQGEPADHFYVLRQGKVSLEVFAPEAGSITVETLGEGEVLGWSWLFPPHKWAFDARALELTRAIALDGRCLREKCDQDPLLGYDLMKRFSRIMVHRLQATRLQLIDLYSPRLPTF